MALDLAAMIEDSGSEVIGPATNLKKALSLANAEAIDFAFVDVNLRGVQSLPVAEILKERGVPFVFLTGYNSPQIETDFEGAEVISKPLSLSDLSRILTRLS